jgi:hypothetical protein
MGRLGRHALVAAFAALGVGASLTFAVGTSSASGAVQVANINVADMSVKSVGCRNVPIQVDLVGDQGVAFDSATVEVWGKGKLISKTTLRDITGNSARGTHLWCPRVKTLGKHQAKVTRISYYTPDDKFVPKFQDGGPSTTFFLKQHSWTGIVGKRRGSTVTIRGGVRFFSVKDDGRFFAGNVPLILERSRNGSKWKRLDRKRVNPSTALATFTVRSKKRASYRLMVPSSSITLGSTSRRIRR